MRITLKYNLKIVSSINFFNAGKHIYGPPRKFEFNFKISSYLKLTQSYRVRDGPFVCPLTSCMNSFSASHGTEQSKAITTQPKDNYG